MAIKRRKDSHRWDGFNGFFELLNYKISISMAISTAIKRRKNSHR
jgi:hypothetical protein